MRLKGLGSLMSILYKDRVDIYRTVKSEDDDNTTAISYDPEPLYTDVLCRLSFSSDDTGTDSDVDRNPVRFNPKLFCSPDVDLKAGDYVTIKRCDDNGGVIRTYSGMVADPSWYSTHQEAFVRIDEGA